MRVRFGLMVGVLAFAALPLLAQGKPTDAQIAHIAYTAGTLDIEAGKQALEISRNPQVRAFAGQMVKDHTAVNEQALALVKKLNVTPEDNATSQSLASQAASKRAELAKLSGAAFDKAYMANEIAFHKTVNGALETTLIPSATNAELKGLLQTGLKLFQGHQQHAEQQAATITIAGMAYSASPVTVKVGEAVEWINKDVVDHTATEKNALKDAAAKDALWNVSVAPGRSATVVMKKRGTFDYFCRYHPNMTGRIVVK